MLFAIKPPTHLAVFLRLGRGNFEWVKIFCIFLLDTFSDNCFNRQKYPTVRKYSVLNPANIFRSNRRTLALYIDPNGDLIIKAPTNMSDRRIYDFVKEKGDWIRARQEQILKNTYINRSAVAYNTFIFLGGELLPVISKTAKQISRQDGALIIPGRIEPGKILKRVEKWLREQAKIITQERAQYVSHTLKLVAASVGVNNNQTRWGSCSKSGVIAINWRAVMLKPELFDYIVVHEFCHLLEFNHTKNFWAVVQTILPEWKKMRMELKRYNWILQLFRN